MDIEFGNVDSRETENNKTILKTVGSSQLQPGKDLGLRKTSGSSGKRE